MPTGNRAVLLAYLPFALLVCLLGVKLIMTAVAAPSQRWGEVQRLISRVTGDVDFVGFHIPSKGVNQEIRCSPSGGKLPRPYGIHFDGHGVCQGRLIAR